LRLAPSQTGTATKIGWPSSPAVAVITDEESFETVLGLCGADPSTQSSSTRLTAWPCSELSAV
jgi:hypothetical protein